MKIIDKDPKIVIAGNRLFTNWTVLNSALSVIISSHFPGKKRFIIVSGTARGADTLGEIWAESQGHSVVKFPPNWAEYGKKAGPIRNGLMADFADYVIVFWKGQVGKTGKGSLSMIKQAKKRNKFVIEVIYADNSDYFVIKETPPVRNGQGDLF